MLWQRRQRQQRRQREFSPRPWPRLSRGLFRPWPAGAFPVFVLLLFDHFHVAGGDWLGLGGGGLFFFRARHGDGDDRDVFVADEFHAGGRHDFAKVDGLAEFEMAHVHDNLFRQIFGQGADFELEQDVFEHAAAVLDAGGFADGFQWHMDDDLFIFGDLVEIHMQHLAVERVVLDILHEREAFGARVAFHGQIHEHVFGDGMVDQILEFLRADFEVLRPGLAAINDGGHPARTAQLFHSAPAHLRARIRF